MTNGQAERYVDTFKHAIKKMEGESNLDENIQSFLFSYRSTLVKIGRRQYHQLKFFSAGKLAQQSIC